MEDKVTNKLYETIKELEKENQNLKNKLEDITYKYLGSRQEAEEYFSTIHLQKEYIRKLEIEIENLKSNKIVDPDCLLTIR